jgi:hypothetical protein
MLPLSHREVYQIWSNYLQLLHDQITQGDFTSEKTLKDVQAYYIGEVFSLTEEGIDQYLVGRWRSLQTELHRLVRLLETDWLFCRSSRRSHTSEQRLQVLRERVEKIQEYCLVLAQEVKI